MKWQRVCLYGLAGALGVALAVREGVVDLPLTSSAPVDNESPATATDRGAVAEVDAASGQDDAAAPPTNDPPSDSNRVFAGMNVTLEAFRAGEAFIGYAVVRSHDPRLSVGDVITAVNGGLVEDSAAGGELLTAALRNPNAELTVQPRQAWASGD